LHTPLEPPSPQGLLGEARGLLELPRLAWHLPSLSRLPRGCGEPVLVVPGYGAGDASTAVLRSCLALLGHRVRGWGLGRNAGEVPELLPRLVGRVAAAARRTGRPLRLVGWSLGGYLAREVARERPELVDRVVTLGSPVVGGPKYTAVAGLYRRRGVDLDAVEAAVRERDAVPLTTPVTAVYSRRDGVVAWQACIDRQGRRVEHVEVSTTHLGLGFAPEVLRVVAESLARERPPDW